MADSSDTIYVWDALDIACTLDGYSVDNLQSFRYSNGRQSTHISAVNAGVKGYNHLHIQPSWEITCNATAEILEHAIALKTAKEYFPINYTAPGIVIDLSNCVIINVDPSSIGAESPTVKITGLALKITEQYKGSHPDS